MKTFIQTLKVVPCMAMVLILLGLQSCKDEVSFPSLTGIYFDKGSMSSNWDSLAYSFAEKPDTRLKDTIQLPVKILGDVVSHDRIIPIQVDPEKTTARAGSHFNILPTIVKANETKGIVSVELLRTPDLKAQQLRLYLVLAANAEFSANVTRTKTNNTYNGNPSSIYTNLYLLKTTDQLLQPETWDLSGSWFKYYFGTYSARKYKFIIEVTGRSVWGDRARYGADAPTSSEMKIYYGKLVQALYDYEQINGPMIDENGNIITFPKI